LSGTWIALANQPTFNAGTMLLLTDGTVLCQSSETTHWFRLTPDRFGNYIHGTWSAVADAPNAPLYFASAVLRDGRVFVAGGEYNAGAQVDLLAAQIFDPVANTWTTIPTPPGWTHIGDAPSCVLPDGRVLLGSIFDTRTAIYDPTTNTWTEGPDKGDSSSEETWTLLPDNTVLAIQCTNHPSTEKYVIATNTWVTAGATPSDLVEASSIETGPCVLLADGRLFAVGATGATALYTRPAVPTDPGSWVMGPSFPVVGGKTVGAKDAPGCLLPDGNVLCAVGPVDGVSGDYLSPTFFFEFNPVASTLTAVANPPNSAGPPFVGRMLLLPPGQVLFSNGSANMQIYVQGYVPNPSWLPLVTSFPPVVTRGNTYTLSGLQLNGLSQAVSYGDDAQMATNYPMVSIRNNATDHWYYCRTHDHSSMGVATGGAVVSTQFDVPAGIETGASSLWVTVNGISSTPVNMFVAPAGIGGYDLLSPADQIITFDYSGTGEQDHLALYRPGTGIIWILQNSGTTFSAVFAQPDPPIGIGGYDLKSAADQAFAFDYDSSGKLDHIVLYRPGTGAIFILKNSGGNFTPVIPPQGDPGNGIGGYDLKSPADRAFAFDYDSSGKLDHIVLYRPGTGAIFILKNSGGNFTPVIPPQGDPGNGIGGYDLRSSADRMLAFDYLHTGRQDHLILYRPGQGIIWILHNQGGNFSAVYHANP
jgi:hypothetical protein